MTGQTKTCSVCGSSFTRNPSYGKAQWARTKYCGRKCAGAARSEQLGKLRPALVDKFRSFFTPGNGCWNWTGTIDGYGYGVIDYSGKRYRAHVLALEFDGRPVGGGMVARHKCDNPKCVNPEHLEVGTQRQNVYDAIARGRFPRGERSGQSKLTENDVKEIRTSDGSNTQLSIKFGVTRQAIGRIRRGETWRHIQ